MDIPSLLRAAEHSALKDISLNGSTVDFGGDERSLYRHYIKGEHSITTVNLDENARPDIVHDLETVMPFPDALYDNALLINVLEHIFNYRQLLKEAVRVIKPNGKLVIVVPFLFPLHPSPQDYWRFTESTLRKELEMLHLVNVQIKVLGSGVFSVRYVMIDRLLPSPLRSLSFVTIRLAVLCLDRTFVWLARLLGKKYTPADYALGYLVTAQKSP